MALAQLPVIKANKLVEAIYFVVAGLGWVLPAMPLIRWMSRPDPPRQEGLDRRDLTSSYGTREKRCGAAVLRAHELGARKK